MVLYKAQTSGSPGVIAVSDRMHDVTQAAIAHACTVVQWWPWPVKVAILRDDKLVGFVQTPTKRFVEATDGDRAVRGEPTLKELEEGLSEEFEKAPGDVGQVVVSEEDFEKAHVLAKLQQLKELVTRFSHVQGVDEYDDLAALVHRVESFVDAWMSE